MTGRTKWSELRKTNVERLLARMEQDDETTNAKVFAGFLRRALEADREGREREPIPESAEDVERFCMAWLKGEGYEERWALQRERMVWLHDSKRNALDDAATSAYGGKAVRILMPKEAP